MTNQPEQTNASTLASATGLQSLVSRRQLFALAGGAALLTACSGDASKSADTTIPDTIAVKPLPTTTTIAATTTTAGATTTTVEATTTTVAPDPVQPLTGLPLTDPTLLSKVVVVVKISNDKGARPQTGLNDADIVFETWGSGPSRFAAVWHSRETDFVGPVRSCREQDVNLVGSFNRAVFACSGGNPGNINLLRSSDLLLITEGKGPGWQLNPNRGRPHKTHANIALLRSNAGPDRTGPAQQFQYRELGERATAGSPMTGFDLKIQQVSVEWRYDAATGTYLRAQDGQPHVLADKQQVSTDNVVIAFLDYNPSNTDRRSPDGQTTGTNPALVFTGGQMVQASWTRADRLAPFAFTDDAGAPVLMTPGRMFIELANGGKGSFPGSDRFSLVP